MKQIFHESHQLSDLKSLCIDHVCCCQIDTQSGQIHQKEKDRFCGRHQLEQILRLFHEVAVFTVKAFGFVAIIVKRANHTDSGEIFTEDAIDTIQRILLSVTERSRYFSYDHNAQDDYRDGGCNDQREIQRGTDRQSEADNDHDRCQKCGP